MTAEALRSTLEQADPPAGLPALVEAMWWEARGAWEQAHRIAQDVPTSDGAWVHAHLHRAEGDPGNASYWYRQAGRPVERGSLQQEWTQIVEALLHRAEPRS